MRDTLDLPSLVEVAGDAIIAADTDGKILLWNPAVFSAIEKPDSNVLRMGSASEKMVEDRKHLDGKDHGRNDIDSSRRDIDSSRNDIDSSRRDIDSSRNGKYQGI
jgi:hypothetical protein